MPRARQGSRDGSRSPSLAAARVFGQRYGREAARLIATGDKEAERIILRKLKTFPVFAEDGEDPGDVRWIVDPLDGTLNYLERFRLPGIGLDSKVLANE